MTRIGDNGYGPVLIGDDLPDCTFKAMEPPTRWGPFRVGWASVDASPRDSKPLGYRVAMAASTSLIVLSALIVGSVVIAVGVMLAVFV